MITRCLEKLRSPLLGMALAIAAFGLSTQSAKAVAAQGCVKINGVLTAGVKVDVFDNTTCTLLASGLTFGAGGDFVIQDATGFANNQNVYLMLTTPDGCIEIIDNATVRGCIVTDPNDSRFCWIALCTDILGTPVQCTTGVTRVVLQYLGTTEKVVTAWATAGSKDGSKGKTFVCPNAGKKGHTCNYKCKQPTATPATPLFINTVKPCATFSITLPTAATGGKGSKTAWKLGSKSNHSNHWVIKPGSKAKKAGSKSHSVGNLTLFVGGNVNTRINANCSGGIAVGQIYGMFRVIRLEDASGNRICPPVRPPQTGNCITSGKPNQLTFQYAGGNCSTAVNSQPRGTKYNCTDSGAIAAGPVRIVISSSATPATTGFFAGTVLPGATFVVNASAAGTSGKSGSFGSNTYAYIYSGGTLVERIQIHTSCSAPLIPGETFGALKLVTYAIVP